MKAIVSKVNDTYFIRLAERYNRNPILINGERFDDFQEGQIKEKPVKVQEVINEQYISFYGVKSMNGEGMLLVEEFQEKEKELKQLYNTDTETWQNLDAEFAYRKFIDQFPPVFLGREKLVDVEIVYLEYRGQDHPYIKPLRLIGNSNDFKNADLLYNYTPILISMTQKIASDLGFEQVDDKTFSENTVGKKWSVPVHSGLEFIKINGTYATTGSNKPKFYGIDYGTWDECIKRYAEHTQTIREWFEKELKLINSVGQNFDKCMVLKELQHIANRVVRIDAKAKSDVQPRYIHGQIQNLINKIG